ncbi:MAG: hypothetical protein WCL50_01770 [Spirochaetota bacterium]
MPRERPGFNEACPSCRRDLHACANCRFFRRGARWDCLETIEGPIVDKDARNHCDWYETSPRLFEAGEGNRGGQAAGAKARGDFDKLFGA